MAKNTTDFLLKKFNRNIIDENIYIKDIKDIEVKDNSKVEYIFKKSLWLNNLLETLTNCSNLKEEISEILPYFRS